MTLSSPGVSYLCSSGPSFVSLSRGVYISEFTYLQDRKGGGDQSGGGVDGGLGQRAWTDGGPGRNGGLKKWRSKRNGVTQAEVSRAGFR